jgi:NADPH:quinone reductase-like Zn-dependent oxidoreductase
MAKNRAAWILSPGTNSFLIAEAPSYKPKAGEVLIKNHAVAVVRDTKYPWHHSYTSY